MSQHLTKSMGKQLNDKKGTLEDSFVTTEVFPQDASINSGGLVDFKVALDGLGEMGFCAHEPQKPSISEILHLKLSTSFTLSVHGLPIFETNKTPEVAVRQKLAIGCLKKSQHE